MFNKLRMPELTREKWLNFKNLEALNIKTWKVRGLTICSHIALMRVKRLFL